VSPATQLREQEASIGGEGLFDEPDEETELDEDKHFEEEENW